MGVSSTTMNLRTNINAHSILAAIIFHTVAGRSASTAATFPINYINDITDSPLVSYYHESYAIPY
jgi:HD superfamily phosphohydrolase YqeK